MQLLPAVFFLLTVAGGSDVDKLQENWKVTSLEANGQTVPEKDFKNVNWKLVVKKKEFTYTAGALVNVADDPAGADFHVAAVVRQGPVSLALGTGGLSPAASAGF